MTLSLDILGNGMVLTFASVKVETHAQDLLSDLVRPGAVEGTELFVDEPDPEAALTSLVGTLNLAAIYFGAGMLMPHAGAVARADGSIALLCGGSGSGKSTLTTALLRLGCAYVTDETSVLLPDVLEVVPFRKPISLKPGSHILYPELRPDWASPEQVWLVPSGQIGQAPLPERPLEPRLLIFPTYDPAVHGTDVRVSTPGEASYLVGSQTSRLRDVADGPLPALARLTRRVPAYHLRYSKSILAAEEVLRLWPT